MRTSPRTSSIARSIGWSNWWRKLVGWLFFDLLLVTIALFIFAYRCNESVIERETLNPASYFSHMALEGDGMSISTWRYEVTTFDDNVTHSFYLLPAVEDIWPVPAFILGWQLISVFIWCCPVSPLGSLATSAASDASCSPSTTSPSWQTPLARSAWSTP